MVTSRLIRWWSPFLGSAIALTVLTPGIATLSPLPGVAPTPLLLGQALGTPPMPPVPNPSSLFNLGP